MPTIDQKPVEFHVKAHQFGDPYGWNSKPGKVNGRPANVAEMWRIVAPNGVSISCLRTEVEKIFHGPYLLNSEHFDDMGYSSWMASANPDWDMTPVLASSIAEVIQQRDVLAGAARAILEELNSAGFLNRGEEAVTRLEEILVAIGVGS